VKATWTRVHTLSESKVTCACILDDYDVFRESRIKNEPAVYSHITSAIKAAN